jgi:hypothetical protein
MKPGVGRWRGTVHGGEWWRRRRLASMAVEEISVESGGEETARREL